MRFRTLKCKPQDLKINTERALVENQPDRLANEETFAELVQ